MDRLLLNRWMTPDGTILTSRFTHDFVQHVDENGELYYVDGGNEHYIRLSLNKEPMKSLCVRESSSFWDRRNGCEWGTRGEDGKQELKYIKVIDMSDDHLKEVLGYITDGHKFEATMREELEYRQGGNE